MPKSIPPVLSLVSVALPPWLRGLELASSVIQRTNHAVAFLLVSFTHLNRLRSFVGRLRLAVAADLPLSRRNVDIST
ncbi:hypothetical protein C8Q73DRAFT_670075 [Cubamyces lactineus]|nr:hypothetical protein C8Q73DRAFT_670075 [Cubamyces lactineus]